MTRGSAALPLQGFLPFYFRVIRAFSILRTRLSRTLEQATLEVLRLRNTISFFFSKPFCAECLVKKAVHCHRRRSPYSLLLRKKAAPRRKWRYFSVQLQAFCCLEYNGLNVFHLFRNWNSRPIIIISFLLAFLYRKFYRTQHVVRQGDLKKPPRLYRETTSTWQYYKK